MVVFIFADLQKQRLAQLRKEFDSEQTTVVTEFDTEHEMMVEQHYSETTELQDIMFAMEQNYNERESDAKSDFQSMRDEIKNKVSKIAHVG